MLPSYCQVVVPVPLREIFHYQIPDDLRETSLIGKRLEVPFGPRRLTGYCVGQSDDIALDPARIKPFHRVLDQDPLLSSSLLKLTKWIASHYLCPWVDVLQAALPAPTREGRKRRQTSFVRLSQTFHMDLLDSLTSKSSKQRLILDILREADGAIEKKELLKLAEATSSSLKSLHAKGWVAIEEEDNLEDPLQSSDVAQEEFPSLHTDQAKVWDTYNQNPQGTFLLHGVTGSGKTEIYLKAIQKTLSEGKQALVLVPEISLTPQTLRRFRARFQRLAVLHSHLTDSQRAGQWQRIHNGEADVIIGARSALFAPTHRLGLIVIDEEHDSSFKQQNSPRYNARDAAIMRGVFENVPVILGSATPQLESWFNSSSGKSKLLSLPNRISNLPLPPVSVVDMNQEATPQGHEPLFARKSILQLKECLENGRQAMLLLNRRGFSPVLRCPRCTDVLKCPRCDISLTVHHALKRLVCHYCNYADVPLDECPRCSFKRLTPLGAGTERIEKVLQEIFPDIRLLRMDADSTRARGSHQKILESFRQGEADVLIGTQMIAKGHDFPNVSLVIVVNADVGLTLPDFRSAERTFALITQMAGRAGRREDEGRVLVQTLLPNHYAVACASRHDFKSFTTHELKIRKQLLYPPFGRLARVLVQGTDSESTLELAQKCTKNIEPQPDLQILGPAPCPLARIDNRFRVHILLKAVDHKTIHRALEPLIAHSPPLKSNMRLSIDVDPLSLL